MKSSTVKAAVDALAVFVLAGITAVVAVLAMTVTNSGTAPRAPERSPGFDVPSGRYPMPVGPRGLTITT